MPDQVPTNQDRAAAAAKPASSTRTWIWRGVFGLFLVYLLLHAWQIRNTPYEPVHWAFKSEREVVAWLGGVLWHELVVYGLSFVLGLLTPPALGPALADEDRRRRWLKWAGCWCFGLLTIFVCFAIARSETPPVGSLILPFVSYLIGLRLSSAAMRGVRPFAWAAGQLAVLLLLIVGATVALTRMTVSAAPLEFDSAQMSMAEKRALAQRIRDTRPPEGQPRRVLLADAEINALVNSIVSRGNIQHRASVHFEPQVMTARASLALPPRIAEGKFLNVRMAGLVSIDQGHLQLGIQELQLGTLNVPRPLRGMLSSFLYALLEDDPQIRRIIDSVDKLDTEQGAIKFVFQSDSISRQVVPSLVQLLWKQPDVAFETKLYLRHLIAVYQGLPADADRFGLLIKAAFEMAAERSQVHDPLLENRAAIFALAVLLGHQDLEIFVGELLDANQRAQVNTIMNTVTLRGRHDLARHFILSAALVLLSHEAISDRIGVLKEELDSQEGGSGFSFVDLIADFSGTRFASMAMRDETDRAGDASKVGTRI